MSTVLMQQIEADINHLSLPDQLWLMERLANRIRKHTLPKRQSLESQLAEMADDPAIQRELRQIENEFMGTEADGFGVTQ